tara:strand:+ start:8133 stop:8504 length:372 start_codon:yes stop_codon:yes gene_type:complete
MINNFVFYIIISVVIISLLHYLYSYFINILTVPKIKDLVNKPGQEYKNIEKIILNNKETLINHNNNIAPSGDDTTDISNLKNITPETKNDMKNELKFFFNELNVNNLSDSNGNNGNNLSYSSY